MSTVQLAHVTLQGSKPHNEDASDAYTVTAPANAHADTPRHVHVVVVADGHGQNGEGLDCARHCMTESKAWVTTQLTRDDWKSMNWAEEAALLTAHLHARYREVCATKMDFGQARITDEQGIVRNSDDDAIRSGSTFSMAMVFPWEAGFRCVTIQVGDSDMFVNGECVECDHSPLSKDEFRRLLSFPEASRLRLTFNAPQSPLVFSPTGEYNSAYHNPKWGATPWRWGTGIVPCNAKHQPGTYALSPVGSRDVAMIGMTRAIGDFYVHPQGMTTEPHVTVSDYPTCPSVFVASDGAFDTLDIHNRWVSPTKGDLGGVDVSTMYAGAYHSGTSLGTLVEHHATGLNELANELFGVSDDISLAVLLP
jgi:hypothetical protein